MTKVHTQALVLQSTLLKSPHGFSTRCGGVSSGIFDSLNFGNPGELKREERDPPANIRANFERMLDVIGTSNRKIVEVHQVHGKEVYVVRRGERSHAGESDTKADAIVTDDPARMIAVRVADCAPVLLESDDGRIVGCAHAGWRGAAAGVVSATVRVMRELGAGDIRAAIGPCIGFDAFEVGLEVVTDFDARFGRTSGVCRIVGNKGRIDLKKAISFDLRQAGVEKIEMLPHCTVSEPGLFFSHRRDKGLTGRMIGIIGPRE